MPKAQRTRGLSSGYQSNFFWSYHKFSNKSWSNFILRISTKHQLQNLNQTSASSQNLSFKILTKPSLRISTTIQLHKHQQKKLANLQLQILPELQLQNLDQTLCSKYEQKFNFMTKP